MMSLKTHILYLVVTVTVMSVQLCSGHAPDTADVFEQKPAVQGRSVESDRQHGSAAQTRHGSLAFKFDEHGDRRSTPGKLQILSHLP